VAGYELSTQVLFQLNAHWVWLTCSQNYGEKPDNTKMKNTSFGVSFGYRSSITLATS
jgi:hypothetical protein